MPKLKPTELLHAEDLLSKGESKEALKIITSFEGTVWRYYLEGDFEKGIEDLLHCKELYEKISGINPIYANNLVTLSRFYAQKGEKNEGIMYAKKSLEIYEQLNDQAGIARSYSLLAYNYGFNINSNPDLAIDYAERSLSIAEIDSMTKADNLKNLSLIYSTQGRMDKAFQFAEEGYKFAQEKKNYIILALCSLLIGNYYSLKGDFDRSLEYFKISLIHSKKAGFLELIGWAQFSLIRMYIRLDSHEQAQEYLKQLEDVAKRAKDKTTSKLYLTAKGLMFKASGRSRDRAEAEKLFKQVVADEITNPLVYLNAVSYLCDFLLEELEMSNNSEIINELEPLITSLLKYAEKTHSLIYISLTKGFQAKLALIQMEFEESRHLLTQAQRIAEQHGLQGFAKMFSTDHDKLLEQLNTWEQLKKDNAPMSKRIKLASFDKIITRMKGMNVSETPDILDEEPILLLIMDNSGATYFNHPFIENWDYSDLFSSFMSAFNTFSDEIFSKSIDRIRIGENTILINPIEPFLACYVIKGQSYPALQKLTRFTEAIRENLEIWQALNKSVKTSEMLELDKPAALKTVINEIFTQ